jgi:hypothetical protein
MAIENILSSTQRRDVGRLRLVAGIELPDRQENRWAIYRKDAERARLVAEVEALKSEILQIRSSTSWRVTQPLRSMKEMLRRSRP